MLLRQVAQLLPAASRRGRRHARGADDDSVEEFLDPNAVKVVTGQAGGEPVRRAPIPWPRDGSSAGAPAGCIGARRHVGLYAYRVGALQRLAALPVAALEDLEKLEQLRALANGMEIRVADVLERPGPDINTAADLARVAAVLRARGAGGGGGVGVDGAR